MSWLGLEGKTAVITGAGGGIGQGLARAFAAEGVRVVLLDRDEAQTASLAAELGMGSFSLKCDVSRADDVAAAAEAVGDDRLAAYLTADAPAAIVAGEAVGPPPKATRHRRRFFLF